MKTPRTAFLLCFSTAAVLAGCSREIEVEDPRLAEAEASLFRAESCGDLETRLKDDARARIDRQMDAYILLAEQYEDDWDAFWGGGTSDGDFAEGDMGNDGGWDEGGDMAAATSGSGTGPGGGPTAGAGDDAGGRGEENAPPDHSGTNNQVEGVDEADIVKTDGERLYVLSGTSFSIVQAWPASALAVEQSLGLEGSPIEMFVEGGKAVIFAQIDGTSIYEAAGVEPRAPYYGGGYDRPGGGWAGDDCWDCYGPQNTLTQVLVLDLAGGAPTVESEYFFEGSYLSSRRVGEAVRIILNGGAHAPAIDEFPSCDGGCDSADAWIEAVEAARSRAHAKIAAASLADFLSVRFQRESGVVSVLDADCTGHWVPTAGTSEYGLTQIETLDLGAPGQVPAHTAIVGMAQTVYANESALVLAGTSYDTSRFIGQAVATSEPVVLNSSYLHRFDLDADPREPIYTGSTAVPGYLIDQFALDERDGVLRAATQVTTQSDTTWSQTSALYTVDVAQNRIMGSVTGLAEGETMFSARFVGDRGYFVTFLQTDPLFVFDISNPSAPELKGELHIPGFSEYMHPIEGGDYLLTIGQDGDEWGTNGGIALQIFDVREATNPILAHKLPLDAGMSEALYNHKAFTFFRDMLAIPFESWDPNDGSYLPQLALYSVDVDAGIQEKGRISHAGLYDIGDEYAWCYPGGVRRGVFIEDVLYSVSSAGVAAHEVDGLAPVGQVAFPDFDAETFCNGYGY